MATYIVTIILITVMNASVRPYVTMSMSYSRVDVQVLAGCLQHVHQYHSFRVISQSSFSFYISYT